MSGRIAQTVIDRLTRLLMAQQNELPDATEALPHKRTHYAWWAFPTTLEGTNEPPPYKPTSVQTLQEQLCIINCSPTWINYLHKLARTGFGNGWSTKDLQRVEHFVQEWGALRDTLPIDDIENHRRIAVASIML